MRKLSVDVYEDASRPEGGHAVIRLNGLESLPDSVTFRIRPVDSVGTTDGAWQNAERQPIVTRITNEGAELVVGPEIVESPLFLPGTLTAIEIQKCGVRGEFLWPRISPLVRPKRRHLLGAKVPREAKLEAGEGVVFGEAPDASSELTPMNGLGATPVVPSSTSLSRDVLLEIKPDSIVLRSPGSIEQAVSLQRPEGPQTAPSQAPSVDHPAAPTSAEPTSTKSDIVWTDASKESRHRWRLSAALLCGVGLVAALLFFVLVPVAKHQAAPTEAMQSESTLAALLSVGTTSPGGTRTRDLTPLQLIEGADALLYAPEGKRDRAEAAFLLKRYLVATMSEERTLWAVTQLGSAYAEPGGARAPDYARARSLWELSATLGDPVAMCFLAALHEHGLGTKATKPVALQWYQRAKEAGGCPNVDEAIARVRK